MTHLTRRATLGGLAASAAALGLASPAIGAGRKVVLGALRFTSHAGTFVAVERDYFKEAGMDVELRFFEAAQPMAVAIASGDLDYAVTAISGGLVSLADKGAIKVIGGALQEEPGIDGQKFLVSDAAFKAGITAPGMLDGKSYGISTAGSSFHYMGAKMAAAEGISLSYKPLQKVGAIIGALKSGQIDAWSIVPHIAKPLAAGGEVHIIGDVATYLPDYQVTTVFTSAKNAAEEKGMTLGLPRGLLQGRGRLQRGDDRAGWRARRASTRWSISSTSMSTPTSRVRRRRPRSSTVPCVSTRMRASTWPRSATSSNGSRRRIWWARTSRSTR